MMKFSEAIRLGAMLRPQAKGGYFEVTNSGAMGSCALGAALEAAGICTPDNYLDDPDRHSRMQKMFPIILNYEQDPELPEVGRTGLENIIPRLNDTFGWTRERIASWVETIEKQHEAAQQPESKPEEIHA